MIELQPLEDRSRVLSRRPKMIFVVASSSCDRVDELICLPTFDERGFDDAISLVQSMPASIGDW